MNDEQFRAIRGLLVTIVILLGLITGILLASGSVSLHFFTQPQMFLPRAHHL